MFHHTFSPAFNRAAADVGWAHCIICDLHTEESRYSVTFSICVAPTAVTKGEAAGKAGCSFVSVPAPRGGEEVLPLRPLPSFAPLGTVEGFEVRRLATSV